jgi:hypothetical protein
MSALFVTALALGTSTLHGVAESPSERTPSWGLELRLGPYQPRISDRADQRQVYREVYANPDEDGDSMFEDRPLVKELEVDYYLSTRFGLLGVSGSVGLWRATGSTRVCPSQPNGQCTSSTIVAESQPGNDTTSLSVLPVSVGLVYRMDLLKRAYPIPLVPYGKAGLDYHFWWNDSAGRTSRKTVVNPTTGASRSILGQGGTAGAHASLGLALNLDWIEPDTAARGRSGIGMADSYLFFEYTWLFADGFGGERLDLSDAHGVMGLSVDFL